ncbi:K(+)-transporting ATPase subunit C [Limnothrix sp. FACHB-1083]|uniref:K(+)-transporting ATPase subunit C n=1 Tax=unclassified Limnothrix TaxID=2632864 RepID=UPI001680C772|nr:MULTISPECIES: K(+)-transporting ATPase subunit C [unclassified Limnothrix]MBD2160353.1 K(+)-transporting ATPase subunit C [Limnothrix sp. FACHB-1083]MBD2191054.1 K(+)-transporting ATPase subunit C [Limnothrix sp. FACHB-1088]
MDFLREMGRSLRLSAALWLLTAVIYPVILLVAGAALPFQANGSLLTNDQGQVIGSALIGQPFTSDRYFWPRPSAIAYSTDPQVAKTGISGASNLAPTNPALAERIATEKQRLQQAGIEPTGDLLYSSGSGLDPHISPASAIAQLDRVARARQVTPDQLRSLIDQATDRPFLNLFGEPGVNVLKLNLALDRLNR